MLIRSELRLSSFSFLIGLPVAHIQSMLQLLERPAGKDATVVLREYALDSVAHLSYLIADLESGVAAVIDPQPDVDPYLEECWRLGVDLRHVFLTKAHTDFAPGHLALRDRACAHLYMGAWARASFPFTPLKNGDVLEFGKVRLQILEIPGHVIEGIAILYYDLSQDDRQPVGIMTGDTVLIGDVGLPRPRLQDGLTGQDLAGMLYDSLRERILPLPDDVRILPSHGAAAFCGSDPSRDFTLGAQRIHNFAFQRMSRKRFVQRVTEGMIREIPGRSGDVSRAAAPGSGMLRGASLAEVLRVRGNGLRLVDVRGLADFAGAHLAGSVNIPLEADFESWAGSILEPETPLILVAEPGSEAEAARRFGRIGLTQVCGYLRDGMQACEDRPDLVRKGPRLTRPALEELKASGDRPVVVDVGTDRRRTPAADLRIPLEELWGRTPEIPDGSLIVIRDEDPFRASAGASLVRGAGRERVSHLVRGSSAWKK